MYYHVIAEGAGAHHCWKNYGFEEMLENLIIPYVNKQVVPVHWTYGKAIFNFSTVSYVTVFKTKVILKEEGQAIADRLRSPEFKDKQCTQEIINLALVGKGAEQSKSLLQTILSPTERQVFVIMKFGDKVLDSAYEGVIKPIAHEFKYKALRIDEIQDSGKITAQILEEIGKSEIVLADLSGERPNCYYEAGFAHAIGKEMILTIQKGTPIHFDLFSYRFIQWETEADLRARLRDRFKAIVQRSGLG